MKKNAITIRNEIDDSQILSPGIVQTALKEVYKEYIDISAKTKRPATVTHINLQLDKFVESYKNKLITEFVTLDIERYKRDLLAKYKINGVNMRLVALKAFFQYAVKMGYLTKNPAKDVAREPYVDVARSLTDQEVSALLNKGCATNKELKDMVQVFLHTGMRSGELLNLRREQIRDGYIHIDPIRSKTGKAKRIPIHPNVKDILKGGKDLVFKGWSSMRFRVAFRRAIIRSKIVGRVRPHDLRHTTASWLLRKGIMSLEEVSKLLGHSSIKTTQIYSHFEQDYLAEKLKKLSYSGT